MRNLLLVVCLLIQLLVLCQAGEDEDNKYLCSAKKPAKLRKLKDLNIVKLDGCSDEVKAAFNDLYEVAAHNAFGLKRVCTMKLARGLTNFYDTYLKQKDPKTTEQELADESASGAEDASSTVGPLDQEVFDQHLATTDDDDEEEEDENEANVVDTAEELDLEEAADSTTSTSTTHGPLKEIIRFAKVFGMRVSGVCKSDLVFNFYEMAEYQLEKEDFAALKKWIRDDSPIARLLRPITKQGEFVLPSDLTAFIPDEFEEQYKTVMRGDFDGLERAQEVCQNVFRPYYEDLIMTIVHLTRRGLNYKTPSTKLWSSSRWSDSVKWQRIVFLCESLKDFKIIDGPPGSEPDLVDIVEEEGKEGGKEEKGEEEGKSETKNGEEESPQPRRYKSWGSLYPNEELMGGVHYRLRRAVSKFNPNLSEMDRLHKKLYAKRGHLMLAASKSNARTTTIMRKMLENAIRKIARKGQNSKDLELAKRQLIDLLRKDEKKFVKAVLMMNNAYWKSVGISQMTLELLGAGLILALAKICNAISYIVGGCDGPPGQF